MVIKGINWTIVTIFLVLALLAIAAAGFVGRALDAIPQGRFLPEIALIMLLLAGIVALVAALSIMTAVLGALGLSDRTHSLGMPPGSVRAMFALSLILIFAITSIFLYRQLRDPPTTQIKALTQAQLADIPGREIISSEPSEVGENLFDVERRLINEASEDFANQVLTLVGTLVTAVASFYFGSKAVETGARVAARPAPEPEPEPKVVVPRVTELSVEDAENEVKEKSLVPKIEHVETSEADPGIVFDQSPEADTEVEKGSTVVLRVAKEPEEHEPPPE